MALDDELIQDIAFRLRQGESVVLRPDAEAWQSFLFQQERTTTLWGCVVLIVGLLGIVLLFSTLGTLGLVPLGVLLLVAIYWRSRLSYRTRHLYPHGLCHYELTFDRVVRYSDTNYDSFPYHELDNIIEERYGLRMERGVAWYEWLWPSLLRTRDKRLLVLPGYFSTYQPYLAFLRAQEEARSGNR